MLKEEVHEKEPVEFIEIASRDLDRLWKTGKIGTMDKRKSVIRKLEIYLNGKKLYFQNIDLKFLYTYEDWLRNIRKNSINTIHKDMKYIKTIFNIAIREQLIDPSINPFLHYKLRTEKTQRAFLSEEELLRIEKCELEPFSHCDMHRDMFIFSAYTGGLRISDVLSLQYSNIEENHININIMKTGTNLSLLLPKKSWSIINKWKSSPTPSKKFVFPFLPEHLDLSDHCSENALKIDKLIASKSAAVNKNLKIIAEKSEISKRLTTHIARHTWATRALRKGISIDKVSKLMGHAQIRETQIYAKIVNTELDKAMKVFDE